MQRFVHHGNCLWQLLREFFCTVSTSRVQQPAGWRTGSGPEEGGVCSAGESYMVEGVIANNWTHTKHIE